MDMPGIASRILSLLKESPRQTPQSMAGRLDASVSTVRNVLVVLSDLGLVEAKVRGLYELTQLGERLLKDISRAR
jgi:Mn-dependent DtxR family transcriptional regulator